MIEKGSSRGTAASYQRAANPAGSVPDRFSPAECATPIGPRCSPPSMRVFASPCIARFAASDASRHTVFGETLPLLAQEEP